MIEIGARMEGDKVFKNFDKKGPLHIRKHSSSDMDIMWKLFQNCQLKWRHLLSQRNS